ncbi:hypothetical protein NUW54_g3300 [Trametes sanguinea]|uniref:Uncharacterized protein n=1 Tax=Trametes sanguinea TaxID=158606 RepID=A0ACC1Q4R1_9APHY|nr:hypothetical protein NUW54_g3300 [Trametes sanguinea]
MRFQTRNLYYLRISATTVIPLYLYLDERHVEWMSERVLQHVLSDLRPLILPKLNAEADVHLGPGGPANAKKGTLDVHRGDTYQFGYFLRGTEPHAVLIKTRTFTAAPRPTPRGNAPTATSSSRQQNSVADKTAGKKRKPKARPKRKGKARAAEDDAISVSSEDDAHVVNEPMETVASRRPKRTRKVPAGGYAEGADDDMIDDEQALTEPDSMRNDNHATGGEEPVRDAPIVPKSEETEPTLSDLPADPAGMSQEDDVVEQSTMDVELVEDEEEMKPKPILRLNYHGFTIHGRCLCVIVEPYPPIRSGTRAPSLAPTGLIAPRAPSIAPPDFVPSEPTPAPAGARNLPPVPLFNETAEASDEDEDGGMVLFSQILRSVGDHPPGIAEDDDEIDGAVFFGDADEMREL